MTAYARVSPGAPSKAAQYIIVILLYILAYLYCIHFAVLIKDDRTGWKGVVNTIHEGGVIQIPGAVSEIAGGGRGPQYFIGAMTPEKEQELRTTVMTFWGFCHMTLYFFIGFLCPDMFWETFVAGCGFELWEKHAHGCQDLLDIIWNTAGFAIGRAVGIWARGG